MLPILPDDRKRLAPIPLPAEEPVAQFVVHGLFAEALRFEQARDFRLGVGGREAVERAAVHGETLARETCERLAGARGFVAHAHARGGGDDLADGQGKLARKLPVALVVRGHRHDRAGAVAEQHVVGDPDRDALAVHRVERKRARPHAGLFLRQFGAFEIALARGFLPILPHRRPLLLGHEPLHERMFRREHHVGRAVERVGPRGENGDLFLRSLDAEMHLRALAPPDPVLLEQLDPRRPVEPLQFINQPLRVGRDPQHPLPHRAPLHRMPADLAFAVDDLLIGQHRAERGAPIHRRLAHVSQPHGVHVRALIGRDRLRALRLGIEPRVIELEKNPLRPFEIAGVGGVDLALPVVGKAEPLELAFEVRHVLRGGDGRMLAGLDRILLGRQAKGIPTHRVQHIAAAHPFIPRENVRGRVALRMPHVQSRAARIREHIEHVILRLRRVKAGVARIRRMESLRPIPVLLPFGFEGGKRIGFAAGGAHGGKGREDAGGRRTWQSRCARWRASG